MSLESEADRLGADRQESLLDVALSAARKAKEMADELGAGPGVSIVTPNLRFSQKPAATPKAKRRPVDE